MVANLKKLRQEYGISQARLAEAIGVSQPSINKYENHDIEPEIQILIRIADFFNTSVDYLIGHTELPRPYERSGGFRLSRDESELITRFRMLREDEKACIRLTVKAFVR